MFKLIFTTEISDVELPVFVLGLNLFLTRHDLIFASDVAWLCWPVFLYFLCWKGPQFTKKQSIDIFTLWWCLSMGGGKGIIGVVLWCYGLFMTTLPYMMGICGLYMASALLMLSMVIGKFMICLFYRLILVSAFMAILWVVGVLFLRPLLWFHVCGNIPCFSIVCS